MKYVNIVIDNKSNSTDSFFTYACKDPNVKVGSKVKVPFATNKTLKDGFVVSLINDETSIEDDLRKKLKEVAEIDEEASLNDEMIRTALWMKTRYLCRYIDVIKCFTSPNRAKAKDETFDELPAGINVSVEGKQLTGEQAKAIDVIAKAIDSGIHDRFLIHGVTGSGKTELYIRAASRVLKQGRGAIILVPEISLTNQISERFLESFGKDILAIIHSKLTSKERAKQWMRIRNGQARVVVGARSAAFAPMERIGLIVVDEEHETTYKSDHTPKYDTVEVALKRLQDKDNQGVLVLGSATPSVVSYSRAKEGIYKLIKLTKRYNEVGLPKAQIVDMRQELKNGNKLPVSKHLADEMAKQLSSGKQVILFLNRRGYSTFISCRECGYVARCPKCGLALTYHKTKKNGSAVGELLCHYCGHTEEAPTACPECGSIFVKYFGSGTEKIEEAVKKLFPDNTVSRVDLDSTKKRGELNRMLKDFEKEKTDILIGTQLIAKGLDFKNVGIVGIISADVTINIPDFRSAERAFQLITQAAGRAGRGEQLGKVVIQTYNPEHYAVLMSAKHDYEGFFETEDSFRKYMVYPPYSDIFQILFTAASPEAAAAGADKWYRRLKTMLGDRDASNIFAPQEAYMSKIRESYRYSLIIKCPKGERRRYTDLISKIREEDIKSAKKRKQDYIAIVDVNPYSFA